MFETRAILVWTSVLTGLFLGSVSVASAQGVMARCYMVLSDGTYIVMQNGNSANTHCFRLHTACAKGRPYQLNNVHFVTPAVLVQAPLEICHAN